MPGHEFPMVQEGEVVTPDMNEYAMKCCDCDLVHLFRFRAIKITEHLPDGTFRYDELDPGEYRVELVAKTTVRPTAPSRKGP